MHQRSQKCQASLLWEWKNYRMTVILAWSNRFAIAAIDSRSSSVIYAVTMIRQEIEQKIDALAREYRDTHDPEIPEEIYELARQLIAMNLTRLRNEATALRNRQEFQRNQLTELASTDFESWAKESFEIATKIAYRNGGQIGSPKGGAMDCAMVAAAPVLPAGYVVSASRIADRRIILAGYRLADLLTRLTGMV